MRRFPGRNSAASLSRQDSSPPAFDDGLDEPKLLLFRRQGDRQRRFRCHGSQKNGEGGRIGLRRFAASLFTRCRAGRGGKGGDREVHEEG
jgi:hypothetical protein